MNERVPLSFLLAQNKDEEPPVEPIVPFPAMFGEDPRIVTAVLERTAILASTEDKYERAAQRHDQVLVDPAMVQWRTRTSDSQGNRLVMPTGKGHMAKHRQPSKSTWRQTNGLVMGGDQERKAVRDLSDERAVKNQQEVRSTEEKEMRFLRQRSAEQATEREKEEVQATATGESIPSIPLGEPDATSTTPNLLAEPRVKKVKLRHCATCGQDKPKAAFSLGYAKGVGKCDDCRSHPVTPDTATQTSAQPLKLKRKYTPRGKAGGKRKYTRRAVAPVATVHPTGHRNGRPSLTLKELMTSVKAAIAERDELRKAVSTLRQEKAELYTQLQELVG